MGQLQSTVIVYDSVLCLTTMPGVWLAMQNFLIGNTWGNPVDII